MTNQTITITAPLGPGDSLTITVAPVVVPVPPVITDLQAALNATKSGGTLDAAGQAFTAAHYTIPSGVTLANAKLTYKGGVGATQSGFVDLAAGAKLTGCTVIGGPYAGVRVWVGSINCALTNCDVSQGPALGVIGYQCHNLKITGGRYHHNNTGTGTGNEQGGIKLGNANGVSVSGAEVDTNVGPGLWADVQCTTWTISGNKFHDNTSAGIQWEISTGVSITGNAFWENGWTPLGDFWSTDLLISSAGGAVITGNTIAWGRNLIDFVSQSRGDRSPTTGNSASGNFMALGPGGLKTVAVNYDAGWTSPGPTIGVNPTATAAQLAAAGIPAAPKPGH